MESETRFGLRARRRLRRIMFAVVAVGSVAVAAHEGHQPLPTRGVEVDAARGRLTVSDVSRDLLDVTTVEAVVERVSARVTANALVTTPWDRSAIVSSRLAGRVVAIHAQPGDYVSAGQMLVEIESLELFRLRSDYRAAVATREGSRRLSEAAESIGDNGAITGTRRLELEVDDRRNVRRLALLQAQADLLGIDATSLQADEPLRLAVTAPISGTILHADLAIGSRVEPSDHLMEIVDTSAVEIRIDLLERDWHRVRPGSPASIVFPGADSPPVTATITDVGGALHAQTRRAAAWARPQPSGDRQASPSLRPGMRGVAEVELETASERLLIPAAAVASDGAETYVLVEEADTAAGSEYRRVPVLVGERFGDRVELTGGEIFPGDRIVARGLHELSGLFVLGVLRISAPMSAAIGLRTETPATLPLDVIAVFPAAVDIPFDARATSNSPSDGAVVELAVSRGQQVRAGDRLARLESLEAQSLQLKWLEAAIDRTYWLERTTRLADASEAVPRRTLTESEARLGESDAAYLGYRDQLKAIGFDDDSLDAIEASGKIVPTIDLRASIDGEVVAFEGRLGQTTSGNRPLFELVDASRGRVVATVPEQESTRIRVGQIARLRFDTFGEGAYEARVVAIAPAIDPAARALSVWLEWTVPPPTPPPHDLAGSATIVVGATPPVVSVPRTAIVRAGSRSFVFVALDEERFERRSVVTGAADDRRIEIRSGLQPDEAVAVSGVTLLQNAFAAVR